MEHKEVLQILQEYKGEWDIGSFIFDRETPVKTPRFSPFPNSDLKAHFEMSHVKVYNEDIQNDVNFNYKLSLVLYSENISSSLSLLIRVKIRHSDGRLIHKYEPRLLKDFKLYTTIYFEEKRIGYFAANSAFKFNNENLIIKCKISQYSKISISRLKTNHETYFWKESGDLIKNFKSVYNDAVLSDFVINVGEKSFPVHKIVLAVHSSVFMKMMTNNFIESKTNSVTVTDATPEIFDLFLKYLYSGEIEDKSWSSIKELYYIADKYDVGILKNGCTDIIISQLSEDLVCEILKLAYKYDDSNLISSANKFAVSHIKELIGREDWKELVKTHPMIAYEVASNFFPK